MPSLKGAIRINIFYVSNFVYFLISDREFKGSIGERKRRNYYYIYEFNSYDYIQKLVERKIHCTLEKSKS